MNATTLTVIRLMTAGWERVTAHVWERAGYTLLLQPGNTAIAINPLGRRVELNLEGI